MNCSCLLWIISKHCNSAAQIDAVLTCLLYVGCWQCYLAALENRDAPPPPAKFFKLSNIQPPPAPTGNVPPPPAPGPPASLVPPAEEPSDEEFLADDDAQCRMLYDFQREYKEYVGGGKGGVLVIHEQDVKCHRSLLFVFCTKRWQEEQ